MIFDTYDDVKAVLNEMNWADRQSSIQEIFDMTNQDTDNMSLEKCREMLNEINYMCWEFCSD